MAQFQGKPPAAEERDPMPAAPGAEELGQAREDTDDAALLPPTELFPYKETGILFPHGSTGGKEEEAQLTSDASFKPFE